MKQATSPMLADGIITSTIASNNYYRVPSVMSSGL